MEEIKFQVLNPYPFKCACGGVFRTAIRHTRKYCYTENSAIKREKYDNKN